MSSKNRLADFRRRAQMSQRTLAEKAGVSQPTIQRAEVSDDPPAYPTAAKIADALGKRIDIVFPGLAEVMAASRAIRAAGSIGETMKHAEAILDGTSYYVINLMMRGEAQVRAYALECGCFDQLHEGLHARESRFVDFFDKGGRYVIINADKVDWMKSERCAYGVVTAPLGGLLVAPEEGPSMLGDYHPFRVWQDDRDEPLVLDILFDTQEMSDEAFRTDPLSVQAQAFVEVLKECEPDYMNIAHIALADRTTIYLRSDSVRLIEMDAQVVDPIDEGDEIDEDIAFVESGATPAS